MTKTEAAEIIATDVRVEARRYGVPISKSLVEERLSEAQHLGGAKAKAARVAPSWRTVLRLARAGE